MRKALDHMCIIEEYQIARLKAESAIVMLQNTNFIKEKAHKYLIGRIENHLRRLAFGTAKELRFDAKDANRTLAKSS